jgi:hypothetical protein
MAVARKQACKMLEERHLFKARKIKGLTVFLTTGTVRYLRHR